MRKMRRFARVVSTMLIMTIAVLGVQFQAHAGLIGAETVIAAEQAAIDRGELLAALDRSDVRQQLIAFGVDPDEARDRAAALSDDELAQMNDQMEQLPAGGNGVIGALVLIFLVLLLTDILGYTDIFPFVKKTVN